MGLKHTLEMRCQESKWYPRIIPQMSHRHVSCRKPENPFFKDLTDSQVCASLHHFLTLCYFGRCSFKESHSHWGVGGKRLVGPTRVWEGDKACAWGWKAWPGILGCSRRWLWELPQSSQRGRGRGENVLSCIRLAGLGACTLSLSVLQLCDPTDCSPPVSSVHGIFQARILHWVAISFSRGSSPPRDWTHISWISCIGRWTLKPVS